MNSLREILESSPQLRGLTMHGLRNEEPQPLGPPQWDWKQVERVLVVRLRSIGDTVLTTPSLFALKRFLPNAKVDILLDDWVAPVLDGFEYVDNVITLKSSSTRTRAGVAKVLRNAQYDVVYNLHGGTTATFLTRASGAKHRVGYAAYQYARLHQHLAPSASTLWGKDKTHSVEQQLALLGWTGVPVSDRPATHLFVTNAAAASISARLESAQLAHAFVLVHPSAAFDTKQWATEKFARIIEAIAERGLRSVVITTENEKAVVETLLSESKAPFTCFADLSLPEVTALASRARLFIGNDSGIAHIASAVKVPSVVIFGSSNVDHWRPWTSVAAEVVREELECQPCHGYFCEKFERPECIAQVPVERVMAALDRVSRA
jgi:predicted lipopolysaccharide heptosyltransferase III